MSRRFYSWKWRLFYYVIAWPLSKLGADRLAQRARRRGWPVSADFVWRARSELSGQLARHGFQLRTQGTEIWAWSFSEGEYLLARGSEVRERWDHATRQAEVLMARYERGLLESSDPRKCNE